jgi:alpha-aminoadipic semialdehyde synthase
VNGSIEFLERTTTIEEPFFNYDPLTGTEVSTGIGTSGITVLGVDILPSELSRESSAHFGEAVSHVLEQILTTKDEEKVSHDGIDTSLLSPGLVSKLDTVHVALLNDSNSLASGTIVSYQLGWKAGIELSLLVCYARKGASNE